MTDQPSSSSLEIQTEATAFVDQFKTLMLATVSQEQLPDCSTAPFLHDENGYFYLFLSALAQHTRNLLHNPSASLMIISDEATSKNLFARQRLILQAKAIVIPRDDSSYESIMDKFQAHLGNTIGLLRTLPDFHLFQLSVEQGNYVQGFAKAFALKGPDLQVVEHRRS